MESWLQDTRFAARSFLREPGFTAVTLLTLALGIGANSAIFSVVNAVVLQPLPFPQADRLVRVTADLHGLGATDVGMSAPELFDYRDRAGLFDDIAGLYPVNANLTQVDVPERVEVMLVSPSYFNVLGARPALGRLFGSEDNAPGIAEVAVISDALWQRRFSRSPDVIGRTLRIDDDSYSIVGVLPPGFRHPGRSLRGDVELWAPAGYRADPFGPPTRTTNFLSGSIARLKPGISLAEARQRLHSFGERLRKEFPADYPDRAGWNPKLVPLHEDVVGDVQAALLVIFGAVALVLLIACANIAGLLLARGAARQRELAVRRALGSGRGRIVRLLLTESTLLGLTGGALGLLFAAWGVDALLTQVPAAVPRTAEVGINSAVVGFTLAASLLTGALFGLAPAIQFSSPDLVGPLKDGRTVAAGRSRLRWTFVAAEFALAMVLLVGAALLVRSFWQLQAVDPGFARRDVLSARIWLPRPNDPARGQYLSHPPRLALFEEILRRTRELPGVQSAAIVQNLPLDGQRGAAPITIDGRDPQVLGEVPTVQPNFASEDYFSAMGIPVLRGRTFGSADDTTGPPVVVINQEMARRFFAGIDPVGQRVRAGGPRSTAPWSTIVGVVGNVLSDRMDVDPRPMMYRPMRQATNLSAAIVVRASTDPASLADDVSRVVRSADPDLPTFAVRTMGEIRDAAMASRRFAMELVLAFAALALLLAAIGVYGVMAYLVHQRTREIGIRVALGARAASIVRLVVASALGIAGAGVVAGVIIAAVLTRLFSGMLFRVNANDPVTFLVIAATMVAAAILAAAPPAWRAARVDPIRALHAD